MKEIVDVEFLPVLDDEDFQREKSMPHSVTETKAYHETIKEEAPQEVHEQPIEGLKDKGVKEEVKEEVTEEQVEEIRENPREKAYEKAEEEAKAYKTYTHSEEKKRAGSRDTSYASFDTAQKQAFKKKKKKIGASIANGILLACAILIGIPLAAFVGFFVVMGVGMAVFFCGMAVGMGVLGLGLAGFTAVAGMGQMGMLCLFGSLLAIGGGGLGLCLLGAIFVWIKRLCVGGYRRIKNRREREVA